MEKLLSSLVGGNVSKTLGGEGEGGHLKAQTVVVDNNIFGRREEAGI